MKFLQSSIVAGVLALCVSPAQAGLVTSLDINVGGTGYTATFHDFAASLSFNDVWDTNGNGVFGDGGAIDPAFDKTPTFWNDVTAAESASQAIISALGTADWVDDTVGPSDGFVIPSLYPPIPPAVVLYLDDYPSPTLDAPLSNLTGRTNAQLAYYAWVTFEPRTVPEPVTPALLLSGLFVGWVLRRRTGRV
jgi:hypothetical protein